jgi:hypothetical protein
MQAGSGHDCRVPCLLHRAGNGVANGMVCQPVSLVLVAMVAPPFTLSMSITTALFENSRGTAAFFSASRSWQAWRTQPFSWLWARPCCGWQPCRGCLGWWRWVSVVFMVMLSGADGPRIHMSAPVGREGKGKTDRKTLFNLCLCFSRLFPRVLMQTFGRSSSASYAKLGLICQEPLTQASFGANDRAFA